MTENDIETRKGGKYMENNGVAVLKDITEDELAKVESFENNGVLIVPRKVLAKLSARHFENNGVLVPYEDGMRVFAGSTSMDAATLDAYDEPISAIQAGKLIFRDDVTPELVKAKIKDLKNYGVIIVPERVYGAVMSRVTENFGKVIKPGENGIGHRHCHGHDDEDDND